MTNKLTDEQVIKQAIEKVVGNGWRFLEEGDGDTQISVALGFCQSSCGCYSIIFSHPFAKALFGEEPRQVWEAKKLHCPNKKCGKVEFSAHGSDSEFESDIADFKYCHYCGTRTKVTKEKFETDDQKWQSYLQEMVLEENPIDYLRRFLEDGK